MKKLIILRHTHALDLQDGYTHDFYRTLSGKGQHQARKIGEDLKTQGLKPDYIVSSNAPRAYQTVTIIANILHLDYQKVIIHSECYNNNIDKRKEIIGYYDQYDIILICGHNPELLSLCQFYDPNIRNLKKGEYHIFNI